jgi:hypothetical protein
MAAPVLRAVRRHAFGSDSRKGAQPDVPGRKKMSELIDSAQRRKELLKHVVKTYFAKAG